MHNFKFKSLNQTKYNTMCTPPIFSRSLRWRVRDFASCFLPSRFPIEEEPAMTSRSSLPKHDTGDRKKINKRLSRRNRQSPRISENVDGRSESSSRPCFNDEEYIVVCIDKDGAFQVIEDGNAKRDKQSSDEGRSTEGEINVAKDHGKGERSSSIRREVVDKKTPKHRTVSVESNDSNQSDGSTGSFAFPVLGREWMGSPVRMPNSQGINKVSMF